MRNENIPVNKSAECELQRAPWTENEIEKQLVGRVLAGETELFATLIQPCDKRIRMLVGYSLGNRAETDDIAQEVRFKAFKYLHQFRHQASFRTWVSRIAMNEVRQFLRNRSLSMTRSLDSDADPAHKDVAGTETSAHDLAQRTELSSTVRRAIRMLPEKMQAVLILRDLEELTNQEAAQRLGLTTTAAKTRHFRARLRLRQFLTEYNRHTKASSSQNHRPLPSQDQKDQLQFPRRSRRSYSEPQIDAGRGRLLAS
jgi:RNA polymerase sigma-70 factor (ECF subfamily)